MSLVADRKVAHELNNQLGVVVSFAELLLDEIAPDYAYRGAIEAIDCAARRLMEVVDVLPASEAAADDLRVRCGSHLAVIKKACDAILAGLPETDPVAADVREMLSATHAVAVITSGRQRPR